MAHLLLDGTHAEEVAARVAHTVPKNNGAVLFAKQVCELSAGKQRKCYLLGHGGGSDKRKEGSNSAQLGWR